jgi:amino acid adenylation domain-containing protein
MIANQRSLSSGFLRSSTIFPDRPALAVDGEVLSYAELKCRAAALAATLAGQAVPPSAPPLTAIFAHRSETAFAGVLAALLRGHGYVPLNPTFPVTRNRTMLERSGCSSLVVDADAMSQLDLLLEGCTRELVVLAPDVDDVESFARRWPLHRFLGRADLLPADRWSPPVVAPDAIAYLLFTSGSTGTPKGVGVTHRNVLALVDALSARYRVDQHDRLSQTFDMTFDLSVFDLFVAWEHGAQVCCPTRRELLTPAAFIEDHRLTIWFCVPSLALLMHGLRALEPDAFPALRLSLFCGEALPVGVAEAWVRAAPNSIVENLYGPTEATVSCLCYRWHPERSPAECENGIVPIGAPHAGMSAFVADDELREVASGDVGELLLCGPQVTPGYWKDAGTTARAFVVPPGRNEIHYRTGDRVRRPAGDGPMTFLGRLDHQIKVHGFRVELGEIEAALRDEAGVSQAVAVGRPGRAGGTLGICAFIVGRDLDLDTVRAGLRRRLPAYMVPGELRLVREFPYNANGKIDRNALLRHLEEERNGP